MAGEYNTKATAKDGSNAETWEYNRRETCGACYWHARQTISRRGGVSTTTKEFCIKGRSPMETAAIKPACEQFRDRAATAC